MDPGSTWIHRLRIIELFDTQVNAGFQIYVGQKMMFKAVDINLLHNYFFGYIPRRICQEASVQKILMMDLMRLNKYIDGIFDCDATGCLDHILSAFHTVHTRMLGLPKSVASFIAKLM